MKPNSPNNTTVVKATMEWRLREQMALRGIASLPKLHERIKAIDPDSVNFPRFCRTVKDVPKLISSRTLLAMALALECNICDILVIRHAPAEPTEKPFSSGVST